MTEISLQMKIKFMELALKIAEKEGAQQKPLVGAVITDGIKFISSGYHKMAGLPHAEIEAIKMQRNILMGVCLPD